MTNRSSQLQIPQERMLLNEVNHRISNELTAAISVISLAAKRSSNKEVRAALADVTELLHNYADVHHALQMPEHDIRMDAAAYLRKLCLAISRSKLERMKIDLVLAAPPLWLQSNQCWLLGMIMYELITNAARHAFSGRNGAIRVELMLTGTFVECRVLDNGSARANCHPGRGLKIVDALAKALIGQVHQKFGSAGSASILLFPSSAEAQITATRRIHHTVPLANDDMPSVAYFNQSLPTPQTTGIEQVPATE
jgi:two-component sensor histidine kinase